MDRPGPQPTLLPRSDRAVAALLALSTWVSVESRAHGALAQDAQGDLSTLSLEQLLQVEVVTAASKIEQTTFQAPGSITIVSAREISVYGYRSLADILRSVPGFWVTDDRNYEHIGVRGFGPLGDYNSRVLLLIDGHRTNNNVYDTAAIGLEFPLDVELIERVEVVRGPGSALYGSNAFFGVVNVVTRSGAALGGPEIAASGGSFETWRGRLSWGRALSESGDVLLSGTLFDSAGQDLFFPEYAGEPSGGNTSDTDYERGFSLFGRYVAGGWRAEAAWVAREKGIPTGSFGTVFDHPGNWTEDSQGYVDLSWQHRVEERWDLAARAFYDRYVYRGQYVYDETANGGPPDLVNDDRGDGEWVGLELRATNFELPGQVVTFGTEVRANLRMDQYNADLLGVYTDDQRDSVTWGIYAQDDIRLAERWHLTLGLRHDDYDTFGGSTNPRAALIYQPDERTAWKLIAGRAFRAPNAYENYYDTGSPTFAELEPETIVAYEAVFERHFTGSLRGSASLYYYAIDDLIVQALDAGSGEFMFQNASSASGPGAEVEIEQRWASGVRLRGSYAWQDIEDDSSGSEMANSPEQMAQLNLETPCLTPRLIAGLELQALGSRATLAGDEVDPYLVTNLTLGTAREDAGFSASISLYNLFDESYQDPGPPELVQDKLGQDGRTFVVSLRWSR